MKESLSVVFLTAILTVALHFLFIYVATVMLSAYIAITPSWHLTTTVYVVGSVVAGFVKPAKTAE